MPKDRARGSCVEPYRTAQYSTAQYYDATTILYSTASSVLPVQYQNASRAWAGSVGGTYHLSPLHITRPEGFSLPSSLSLNPHPERDHNLSMTFTNSQLHSFTASQAPSNAHSSGMHLQLALCRSSTRLYGLTSAGAPNQAQRRVSQPLQQRHCQPLEWSRLARLGCLFMLSTSIYIATRQGQSLSSSALRCHSPPRLTQITFVGPS
jgi:hypothetical protein